MSAASWWDRFRFMPEMGFVRVLAAVMVVVVAFTVVDKRLAYESRQAEAERRAGMTPAQRQREDSIAKAKADRKSYLASLRHAPRGETGRVRDGFVLCRSLPALSRYEELMSTDPTAAISFMISARCDFALTGALVIVEAAAEGGRAAVHYQGNPQAWYVEHRAVAASNSPDFADLARVASRRDSLRSANGYYR